MRIGVDPGYETTGWAEMDPPYLLECGVIRPKGTGSPDVLGFLS